VHLNKISEKFQNFDKQFKEKYHESPNDELSLDVPLWTVDSSIPESRIVDFESFMIFDNKINFKRKLIEMEIEKLRKDIRELPAKQKVKKLNHKQPSRK
jgi:hypothetical protein